MAHTLTKQEWIIMEAFWDKHPMGLAELMHMLRDRLDWSPSTYLTYLKRLVNAGCLRYDTEHGNRLYEPLLTREEGMQEESRSLMNRMTEESRKLLVLNMVREGSLSVSDRQELKDLIDCLAQKEGEGEE